MSKYIYIYLGNDMGGEGKEKRYAEEHSITRAEFYQAKQASLKPSLMVEVRNESYSNEKYLWYKKQDGDRYRIIRTHKTPDEKTELYCERI